MRICPLILAALIGCPRPDGDGTRVTGELGGEAFLPGTVVFDEFGAGPGDTASPEQQELMLVLADGPEICPLLGPLFHYSWLRCESACEGLYAGQALWPSGELRTVWVDAVVDGEVEAAYQLARDEGPGLFTATYRSFDISPLAELDQQGCFDTCSADYGFLMVEQVVASVGDLEIDAYSIDQLDGELDLLFSPGDVQASFEAPWCPMGLHNP